MAADRPPLATWFERPGFRGIGREHDQAMAVERPVFAVKAASANRGRRDSQYFRRIAAGQFPEPFSLILGGDAQEVLHASGAGSVRSAMTGLLRSIMQRSSR